MIFDESTAMLDPIGRREVLDVIEHLVRDRGITVLNITHHMNEAARADRVIVMDGGKVIADGTPERIFTDEELIRKAGLELPQSSQLLKRLMVSGLDFDTMAIDPGSCAELIYKKIQTKNKKLPHRMLKNK
jgi:energy-coupling factor transport system ATP-binding protein